MRILIAANEPALAESAARFLRIHGHDVRTTASLAVARLGLADPRWLPDAVIADYRVGEEPVGPLLEGWRGRGPFLVWTGRSTGDVDERTGQLATAVLRKPFHPSELLDHLA